jgi:toxin CcdB
VARYDVYANPDKAERALVPFFLDVQNDHLKGLQSRVVVPLWDASAVTTILENINPVLDVNGHRVVMDTPAIGSAPSSVLKSVANVAGQQLAIQDALDALFGAY